MPPTPEKTETSAPAEPPLEAVPEQAPVAASTQPPVPEPTQLAPATAAKEEDDDLAAMGFGPPAAASPLQAAATPEPPTPPPPPQPEPAVEEEPPTPPPPPPPQQPAAPAPAPTPAPAPAPTPAPPPEQLDVKLLEPSATARPPPEPEPTPVPRSYLLPTASGTIASHELTAGEPISDLIRGLLDDSALSAAALQSLTSLRQTAELTIQPPPSALIMEAGQVAGALQNLSLRLRQRAADAQRGQLAVARSHERENALQHKLAIAERSEAAMRDEHGSLSQKLREAEAKVAQLQMSEQHLATMENAKLHSKVRELEASLIGEKELNKQLQRALHRMASEKTADEGGAHKKAAEAAAEAALATASANDSKRLGDAAASAIRAKREAAVCTDSLQRELIAADAELCAVRVELTGERAALQAAQATLQTERTAKARSEEALVNARRESERLAASLASYEEQNAETTTKLREFEALTRRHNAESSQARDQANASLVREESAHRVTVSKLEGVMAELAGTRAELTAQKEALEATQKRSAAELVTLHGELSAMSAANAADRANLLSQLNSAHSERTEAEAALARLRSEAETAKSLDEVMPSLTKLIEAVETSREEAHARAFQSANAAANAANEAAIKALDGKAGDDVEESAVEPLTPPAARIMTKEYGAATEIDAAITRAAEWEKEVIALREQIESLEMELESRPSVRAVKELSMRVAELEGELGEERRRRREPLWQVQHVPKHVSPTRDAIKRDKELHRLGGCDIDSMSPKEQHTLLLDTCRVLGIRSVHSLLDRVKQLCATSSGLPALETFVRTTRAIVHKGSTKVDVVTKPIEGTEGEEKKASGGAFATPKSVLEELKKWADERIELYELRTLKVELNRWLGKLHAAKAEAAAMGEEAEGEEGGGGSGAPAPAPAAAALLTSAPKIRGRRTKKVGEAEQALARLCVEAIGDDYAAAAAASGLSTGGVCAAVREMVGASSDEGSLKRVRLLCGLEREVHARTVEVAMHLGMPPDASLAQCVAKMRAGEASKEEAKELIDLSSARELLRRLRAHNGPTAIEALEALEAKGKEYRQILGRFQQQMTDFSQSNQAAVAGRTAASASGVVAGGSRFTAGAGGTVQRRSPTATPKGTPSTGR